MEAVGDGDSRRKLLAKLVAYATIYGLIHVNYIDLVTPGGRIPGYHLWLLALYLAPFVPIIFVLGLDGWDLVVGLGLLTSLMNDLFYAPAGMILFGRNVDLVDWYSFQLGLRSFEVRWVMDYGFVKVPVSSVGLAATIYLRILLVITLLWRWFRK
ncbi:MAG: hypothetical protein QXM71_07535 [Thermofilum sp.]